MRTQMDFPIGLIYAIKNKEGHNMVQSLKLQSFDGEEYYDLDGYPWET